MTPCPGAVAIVANGRDYRVVAPDTSSIIADLESLDVAVPPPARLIAVYSGNADQLPGCLIRAAKLNSRVFAVNDSDLRYPPEMLRQLRPFDIPALECYLRPYESTEKSIRRWDMNLFDLSLAWSGDFAIVWGAYTENGAIPLSELLRIQPYVSSLVNRYPRVKIVAPFAWDRADGGHIDALAETIVAIAAASPGNPTLLPIPQSRFPQSRRYGGRMKVYLKYLGKYIGVDPSNPSVVYVDRTSANGWEAVTLAQLPNKRFTAWFDAAKRYLTIDDTGKLRASVDAASWEQHCAITPPDEYKDTPSQLYQPEHGALLEIEVQ